MGNRNCLDQNFQNLRIAELNSKSILHWNPQFPLVFHYTSD